MNLLILKTDLESKAKVQKALPFLNSIPGVKDWSVDTEDCDNVLRMEAIGKLSETQLIDLLKRSGIHSEELKG